MRAAALALLAGALLPGARGLAGLQWAGVRPGAFGIKMSSAVTDAAPGAAQTTVPETFRRQPCEPGVYVKPDSPLISVLASIEELASWKGAQSC
jgi:hypothetical protein